MDRDIVRRIGLVATSWPLVASLVALLLNDHVLKAAYPGWVTGKLSDFAGILLVALFAMAAFPRRTLLVAAAICAAFIWWKSPASEPFIQMVSTVYPIGRTVDYTDLIAFAVLPFAARVARGPEAFQIPIFVPRRLAVMPIIAVSALAVMASYIPMQYQDRYVIRATDGVWPLELNEATDAIKAVATRRGMACPECGPSVAKGRYVSKYVTMKFEILGRDGVSFEIHGASDRGIIDPFGDGTPQRMDELRDDLKREFGKRARNLELVESLNGGFNRR